MVSNKKSSVIRGTFLLFVAAIDFCWPFVVVRNIYRCISNVSNMCLQWYFTCINEKMGLKFTSYINVWGFPRFDNRFIWCTMQHVCHAFGESGFGKNQSYEVLTPDRRYDIKIILKSHFWCKRDKILSLCTQRCYERHNATRNSVSH